MNTPVSFELAKLLKEKGYDKPTQKAYIGNDVLFVNFEKSYGESEYYFDADDFYKDWNKKDWVFTKDGYECFGCKLDNVKYFEAYSAPPISEVVIWLYEKHGIWIEVYIDDNGTFGYLISRITKEGRIDSPLKREFNSPTEAYEAAIEYTLKNLVK